MLSISSSPVVLCSLFISLVASTSSSRHRLSRSHSTLHSSRASALQEVEAIQATLNFMICQIGQQGFAAAEALGITSQSIACIVPGAVPGITKTASASNKSESAKVSTLPASVVPEIPQNVIVQAKIVPVVSAPAVINSIAGVAIGDIQAAAPALSPQTRSSTIATSSTVTSVSVPTPTSIVEDPTITSTVNPNICTSLNPQDCINQAQALEAHNVVRAAHHAAPLIWNATLAEGALRWANTCQWKHSGGTVFPFIYGENLYSSTLSQGEKRMNEGIQAFANEEAEYDYSSPGYSEATGHFTQVVWQSTQQVGCALITCDLPIFHQYTNVSSLLVCEYFPSGNWLGEFAANVLKP